ncbi:ATP synthase F1 subunit gamma [Muribaculaceae bacterium Isolate-013 (NCI)]|jgi:F-type H+-transporting ATPase subunit gamma|nr:ATP synthase F1 subunit gamma [Muribaculaceae bacterium Isolate-013 (NCI)]
MATLRELKGRIGSVASSEKITGAMKMISSAKMHKAEQALRQLRPFRDQVETIMANLADTDATFSSPLMEERPVQHAMIVVWGSDDGLCGAYNVNIFKQLLQKIAELRGALGEDVRISVCGIGSKIAKACAKLKLPGVEAVAAPAGVDSKSSDAAVRDFIWSLRDKFTSGEVDRVDAVYMSFKSISRQRLESAQLLPVAPSAFASASKEVKARPYIFEPSAEAIFNRILPMYLLAVMHDIFTENRASEQAARVMAMQSANDNAKKLRDQLNLEFNKLRQAAITTELLDILGGQVRD